MGEGPILVHGLETRDPWARICRLEIIESLTQTGSNDQRDLDHWTEKCRSRAILRLDPKSGPGDQDLGSFHSSQSHILRHPEVGSSQGVKMVATRFQGYRLLSTSSKKVIFVTPFPQMFWEQCWWNLHGFIWFPHETITVARTWNALFELTSRSPVNHKGRKIV